MPSKTSKTNKVAKAAQQQTKAPKPVAKLTKAVKAAAAQKKPKSSAQKSGAKDTAKESTKKSAKKTSPIGFLKKVFGAKKNEANVDSKKKADIKTHPLKLQAQPSKAKSLNVKAETKSAKAKAAMSELSVGSEKTQQKSGSKKEKHNKEEVKTMISSVQVVSQSSSILLSTVKSGFEKKARRDNPICREVACELMATTANYCRMHYIKNWKKIKRKEIILKEKKLNHYVEELISKYPDKYIEAIRQDLASEKDFAKVISDLEIDEGMDDFESVETESAEGIIDTIKRDFEDDGDGF